ncbi:ATP-binding cassette domain-containing protein [Cellulosilyticum ruminicola]|uniref:ATP-binding cassette domain-containing protein n=1 Tax=Cellulosilyticum ruminicola TaxID=425254 RepID=UPI00241FD969|nr:ABC transporter ATP-binding protein [Cellulosilyticum ruminicola]
MLRLDTGEIKIDGLSTTTDAEKIKAKIGYVGEPTGYPEESQLKHIKKMIAPFYETWDETLFKKYVKHFKVNLDKKYEALSTGQKKQFDLIMALSHKPELIILDEPTAGLDPIVRNEMLEVLMTHMQDEKVSIFYSTHITSDLEKTCDYLVYIQNGKIRLQAEKDKLLSEYCIVKGPKKLFEDKEIQREMLGIKQTSLGGEALVRSHQLARELFGEEATYCRPNIEEVMLFLAGERRV